MPNSHISVTVLDEEAASRVIESERLLLQFCEVLGVRWELPDDLRTSADRAIKDCGPESVFGEEERRRILLALVNSKFGFNIDRFQQFLDGAAAQGIFLNYHDKMELREALDYSDINKLDHWLISRGLSRSLRDLFAPITPDETLRRFSDQLKKPTISRSDARSCDPAERRESILRSLFGSFIFCCFPKEKMHRHLNPDCRRRYFSNFYDHVQHFHPTVLHRQCALMFLVIDDRLWKIHGPLLRDSLCQFIEKAYSELSNHCYLAILIKPFTEGDESGQWRLFSDLVLYAEKHRETELTAGYFRPSKVEAATREHVPLPPEQGQFHIANEGFFFRDCIVLLHGNLSSDKTSKPYDLLLLFDKNERDETLVPCPACRSLNVRGNSYPTLGVKSWECQNPICPERSAFDRGNRYSVAALIKRQAIASDEDQIPVSSLRRWKLDLVSNVDESEVVQMLLRHFSLHGDTVQFVNTSFHGDEMLGRRIVYRRSLPVADDLARHERFQNSVFFSRFIVQRPEVSIFRAKQVVTGDESVELYNGDAFEVLSTIEAESIDGAVTSPPYYNARSYSVWPNIYCYLYDMYSIAQQVYRVLRPGAYYLFNIFDYFDNENNIVFSAMGKKRMILGAYIINIFRRVGFKIEGNTVWFKGEIEGKRNFNQGNRSPYYQLPFNCWEHVLIFRKPGGSDRKSEFPTVLSARPVIKMVRGQNTYGHSAPYPSAIPELLISQMRPGERVLDPFSGSMTTGRTAKRYGLRSLSIELHREYCDLGIKLLRQEASEEGTLFLSTG